MKLLDTISKAGTAALGWVGLLGLVLMIVHVTLDVTLRYLLNAPLVGTIMYVSLFYMVAVAFLPLSAVEEEDAQISVEVVTELLPQGWRSGLSLMSLVLSGLVFGGLAVRSAQEAMVKFRLGSYVIEGGTMIPTWPTYFFLPVGFGFATLVILRKAIAALRGT